MSDATQYAIDIVAQMRGDETSSQLDAMAKQLSGGGRQAAAFEDALTQLEAQLRDAGAASAQANAVLADSQAEYRQLEQAAVSAARAAERAELRRVESIEKAQAKLAAAQKRLDSAGPGSGAGQLAKLRKEAERAAAALRKADDSSGLDAAKAKAAAASAALSRYRGVVERLEGQSKQAAAAQRKLSQSFTNMSRLTKRAKDQLGDAATRLSTFRGALGDVGGPLGEFGERLLFPVQAFVDLNEWFGKSTATLVVLGVGIAAITAALAVMTAAAVAAVAAFTALAIKMGDAARSARLTAAAYDAAYPAIAGVSSGFAELTRRTGVTADALRGLTLQLNAAKTSAADMPAALRAVATAEAALGQGKGLAYFNEQLKAAKGNVFAVSLAIEQKFGGIVARQMLGLEAQSERFKSNAAGLFDDLDIEPVLKGFRTLVELFDENTAAGRAMKALLGTVLQPIIDQAQNAAWAVEAFVLGFLIGLTKLYIRIKPVTDAVAKFFGLEAPDLEATLKMITKAGEIAVPVFLGLAAGAAAVGAALLAGPILLGTAAAAVAAALGAAVVYVVVKLAQFAQAAWQTGAALGTALQQGVEAAIEWLGGLASRAGSIGGDIMRGLAAGITGAAGAVVSAMTGAVGGAISAAKRQLGIASPSKVFAQIGGYTARGFAGGVEAESGRATKAVAALTSPVPAARAAASTTTNSTTMNNSRGPLVVIESLTLGAGSGREQATDFYETLTRLLEGDATALGAA